VAELNRASPLPLYAQLARQVEARILSGTYASGSTIPSENALSDEFGVGRPTVRQATDELIKKGLLKRRRGAGTFVREGAAAIDLFSLGGTIRSFEDKGVSLTTRLVKRPVLAKNDDGKLGYQVTRLSSAEGEPILLEEFWLDREVFVDFDQLPISGRSLSQMVSNHYGLVPLGADQAFLVVALKPDQARHLSARARQPALLVKRNLHFSIAKSAVSVQMLCKKDARYTFCQSIGGHLG